MKLEVNINKTYFFLIIGSLLILSGIIISYAYPTAPALIPNPGHTLTETQGYFQGDTSLNTSLNKFCQTDGTNCQGGPTYFFFSTNGAHTWTVPSNVYHVILEVQGAGGGGGAGWSMGYKSGGGGAGQYVQAQIPVTPGQSYTINVGKGGRGGIAGDAYNNYGANGGPSSFTGNTININSVGGQGGAPGDVSYSTGGAGGSNPAYTLSFPRFFNFPGERGHNGGDTYLYNGDAAGGQTGIGVSGGPLGYNGTLGSGGGGNLGNTNSGYAGGDGYVKIYF